MRKLLFALAALIFGVQSALAAPVITGLPTQQKLQSVYSGITNGTFNASMCAYANRPSWCAGSDVGAWINSAIAAQTNNYANPDNPGTVILSGQTQVLPQSTMIKLPLSITLDCQGTQLQWQSTSGTAIQSSSEVDNSGIRGPLKNCTFSSVGSANTNTNVGLYLGGDTYGVNSTPLAKGFARTLIGVRITGFQTGLTWGSNTFIQNYDSVNVDRNNNNILVPRVANFGTPTSAVLTSNVLTITMSNSAAAGNSIFFSGMTGSWTFLNNTAGTVTSATGSQITLAYPHANVSSSAPGGTVYYNGTFNSGELIRFTNVTVSNAKNCGVIGLDVNSEVSFINSSFDYNFNGEFCNAINAVLISPHLERTNVSTGTPYFVNAGTFPVKFRIIGGGIAAAGTGTDAGLIYAPNSASEVRLSNIEFYATHPVTNFVYTGAAAIPANQVCITGTIYLSSVKPGDTDSTLSSACAMSPGSFNGPVAIGASTNPFIAASLAMDDCGGGMNGGCAGFGSNTASILSIDWNNGGIKTNKVGGRTLPYAFVQSGSTTNRPQPWVNGYSITAGGSGGSNGTGYSATFSGGTCASYPTASYTIAGGAVSAVQLRNLGSCTSAPSITFASGGVTGASATTTLATMPVGTQYFDTTLGQAVWLKSGSATWVDANGSPTGGTPTLASCGTSPSISAGATNGRGEIQEGTGSPAGCTLTFATSYTTVAPSCIVTSQSGVAPAYAVALTGITVTNGSSTPAGSKWNYVCMGGS